MAARAVLKTFMGARISRHGGRVEVKSRLLNATF
jgi:hypothetical protein